MKPALEQAQTIALHALTFIARDPEVLGTFLTTTGIGPQELKDKMSDPEVMGGVLDHLIADDRLMMEFCNEMVLSPETVMLARRALPGGFEIYG